MRHRDRHRRFFEPAFSSRAKAATGQGFAIPIDQAIALGKQIGAGKSSTTVHVGSTAFLGIGVGSDNGFDPQGFGQTATNGVSVGLW